jgi:hypothetical protein
MFVFDIPVEFQSCECPFYQPAAMEWVGVFNSPCKSLRAMRLAVLQVLRTISSLIARKINWCNFTSASQHRTRCHFFLPLLPAKLEFNASSSVGWRWRMAIRVADYQLFNCKAVAYRIAALLRFLNECPSVGSDAFLDVFKSPS